jgi:hypothetical protein
MRELYKRRPKVITAEDKRAEEDWEVEWASGSGAIVLALSDSTTGAAPQVQTSRGWGRTTRIAVRSPSWRSWGVAGVRGGGAHAIAAMTAGRRSDALAPYRPSARAGRRADLRARLPRAPCREPRPRPARNRRGARLPLSLPGAPGRGLAAQPDPGAPNVVEEGAETRVRVSRTDCEYCGQPLPAHTRGLPRRWCSERCRWQGRKAASRAAQQARDREIRALLETALKRLGESDHESPSVS